MMSILFLSSCASFQSSRHSTVPGSRNPPVSKSSEEMTPERKASDVLVEQGQAALNEGRYDHAADLFQESISVDPSNGIGYYSLAAVKFQSGEYGDVWNLLDKAELLLSNQPEMLEKIQTLRLEVQKQKPEK